MVHARIPMTIAAVAIVNIIYVLLIAPYLDSLSSGVGFAGIPWLLAFSLAFIYGVISFRFTQGEFGVKELLRFLAHLAFGWLRHWRLIVCLVLVTIGLVAIGASPRIYSTAEVTGYRYVLLKDYAHVVGSVTTGTETVQVVTGVDFLSMRVDTKWITYVSRVGVGLTTVLADVHLLEFPVITYKQLWYLDMGFVLAGLALIVAGLLFGTYHVVIANNKMLEVCGEHTAKYHANLLRLAGYEVPEGYEEALAWFYKTGDISKLKQIGR